MSKISRSSSQFHMLFALIFMILFSGCMLNDKKIEITDVFWVPENIDSNYWSGDFDSATCFHNFWLDYEGDDIDKSDIEEVKISDSYGTYWLLNLDRDILDTESKSIGTWERFWNDRYAANGSVMAIGTYYFTVTLKSGHVTVADLEVPAPGSTSTDGYDFIYTEEYGSSPPSNYTQMIRRAQISDVTQTGDLTITFSVDDSRVYSGWIWLYADNYNFVCYLTPFRDYSSGAISSIVNGGINLHTDGSLNTIVVDESDLTIMSGMSLNDTAYVVIVLTDGYQYADERTYDCRSISAPYWLQGQTRNPSSHRPVSQ